MKKGMKGVLIFFAVMLFFTVVSRATDSFLVAQVIVDQPSSKKIEHIVSAAGSVERSLEVPLLTEPDLLIHTVYVQEGESVTEGQILASIDDSRLEKQIGALKEEIHLLKLQENDARSAAAFAKEDRQRGLARAKEDYENAVNTYQEAQQTAEREKKAAEDALNRFLTQKERGELSGVPDADVEAEEQRLFAEMQEKQTAYEKTVKEGEEALCQAKRVLEDASAEPSGDHSAEIGAYEIREKEDRLDALEQLQQGGGTITAPQDGTITGVFVATGQKTTDTAAFTMAVSDGSVTLVAEIAKDDAVYVKAGDQASVKKSGTEYEGFFVSAVKQKGDGGLTITVESEENGEAFRMGEYAEINIVKQSELYGTAIPLTALHTDQNGSYVYVLSEKETVLGTQQFAQKIEVTVLEKNISFAALRDGVLGNDSQIIVDSDRYINAGDRVRLQKR